jgi:death-on-curing family protein
MSNAVEIYKTQEGEIQIEVQFEKDTVWLNRHQLVLLFDRDIKTIGKHINNAFKERELEPDATVAKIATVQKEGNRLVEREVEHYNLDVIISVGYRVKSKRGTQFRQWATKRLKDYLVQGYALNQKRLEQLQQIIQLISKSSKEDLLLDEAKGLLEIINSYTQSFILLNQYDSNKLSEQQLNENITYAIQYEEAVAAIAEFKKQLIRKKEASELFGNRKDESFQGTLQSVLQTFDGQYLYPSVEEQAAHLLYFIIKNHPFVDGNKRIGAFLFVWFLEKNRHRFKKNGEVKINDNGLTALALLTAQSNPDDKDLMIKLIINLIRNT